jgi:hypothetical protein
MGDRWNKDKIFLVGNDDGKRPLGRHIRWWVDNMLLKWILKKCIVRWLDSSG